MKVYYDDKHMLLYIEIKEDEVTETKPAGEGVFIDLNKAGEVVGIEIWDLDKVIDSILEPIVRRAVGYIIERRDRICKKLLHGEEEE